MMPARPPRPPSLRRPAPWLLASALALTASAAPTAPGAFGPAPRQALNVTLADVTSEGELVLAAGGAKWNARLADIRYAPTADFTFALNQYVPSGSRLKMVVVRKGPTPEVRLWHTPTESVQELLVRLKVARWSTPAR